jgi:hypothetical protein
MLVYLSDLVDSRVARHKHLRYLYEALNRPSFYLEQLGLNPITN